MKFYVALAINKDDPKEIYGMDDWGHWLKGRVLVWTNKFGTSILNSDGTCGEKALDRAKPKYYTLKDDFKGKMSALRKSYTTTAGKHFCPYGRSPNEYAWVWLKHYATSPFRRLQHNQYSNCEHYIGGKTRKKFKLLICRLGSKHCPIEVDMKRLQEGWHDKKDVPLGELKRPYFTVK